MALIKQLPKSENGPGVLCKITSGEEYCISWNMSKDTKAFTLWKIQDGGYEKLKTGNSPQDLYKVIFK